MRGFALCLQTIFLLNALSPTALDSTKLMAVCNKRIAQALYRTIRNDSRRAREPPTLDPDTKLKICHYITGSTYVSDILEEKRVFMHLMHDKLKHEEPRIYALLYEASENAGMPDNVLYTNRTRLINVDIHEDDQESILEYVFACLTIRETNERKSVQVYYVSNEYNLSDKPNPYIAGRFIFEGSLTPSNLYYVAEEPAQTLSASSTAAERAYLLNRMGNEPAEDDDDDPVCKLNQRQRLRVCTLVLSSAYFQMDLKFTPDESSVDAMGCVLHEISFRDDQAALESRGKFYEEWMISCRPRQYYTHYQAAYFLSRVYNSNDEVFVYRKGRNSTVVVENLFGNIRFKI